jgi:hypothetical protein
VQAAVGARTQGRDRIESEARRGALTPLVMSGAAVVAATFLAGSLISPLAESTPLGVERHSADLAVRLAADASIANIPVNLFYAIANIPNSQVQALDELARSLFFTGNWFVGSSTNIWGSDPADPGHYQSVIDLFLPFPALAKPFGYQISMLAAAEIPVNASCAALECPPVVPLRPITGITGIDKTLWTLAILVGLQEFPLLNGLFRVPLSDLISGYTFGDVVNPAGPVNAGYGFEGTRVGPNGEPLMPWSGTSFTLDFTQPWKEFYDSLIAPPQPLAEAVHIPTLQDYIQTLAAVWAGLVVNFNVFVPGSPFCPGECKLPDSMTTEGMVGNILKLSPGNALITQWLADTAAGTANGPTQAQTDFAINVLQGDMGFFKFDPDTTAQVNAVLRSIHPLLPDIAVHGGLMGAYTGPALLADFGRLLGINQGTSTTPVPATSGTPELQMAPPVLDQTSLTEAMTLGASSRPALSQKKWSAPVGTQPQQQPPSTPVEQSDDENATAASAGTQPEQQPPSTPVEQNDDEARTASTDGASVTQVQAGQGNRSRNGLRVGDLLKALKPAHKKTDSVRAPLGSSSEQQNDTHVSADNNEGAGQHHTPGKPGSTGNTGGSGGHAAD